MNGKKFKITDVGSMATEVEGDMEEKRTQRGLRRNERQQQQQQAARPCMVLGLR